MSTNPEFGSHQQWFEVQRYLEQVYVARQSGRLPHPEAGQVVVKMVACGICGADIRVITGNKVTSGDPTRHVTLGHEGVGTVVMVGEAVTDFKLGDYVVILPHVHLPPSSGIRCQASQIEPECCGNGHTLHMGLGDTDGCFADFIVMPATNVVRIAPEHLHLATELAPSLREAIFALTEPMLCTLSAYEKIELHLKRYSQRDLVPGRALVIGCGPIGVLHGVVLLKRGFEVWFADSLPQRAKLARWCLSNQVHLFDPKRHDGKFNLVMVTASSVEAIRMGETLVQDDGILYVFAGLNATERAAMDPANVFSYERLHRTAKVFPMMTRLVDEEKNILYGGHSGYFEKLAPKAIATVAANAAELELAVTGVIRGWTNPRIESRLPGGTDWPHEDGPPVIISVLKGADLRDRHCKLLVLTDV